MSAMSTPVSGSLRPAGLILEAEQEPVREAEAEAALVGGRYRLCAVLGRGGMATVYRAEDERTSTTLALKLLSQRSDPRRWQRAVARFEREYHALTQLVHPRVVQVFDYGIWEGQPYYTMELVDGGDLRSLSPLPYQDVCTIAYEACSVLSLLHSRRMVHRDVTPSNIRRTADGRAKLLDFGLVSPMGVAGLSAGTPSYAAPELVQGLSLDGRSDLFSLGATLYLALTGRPAFPARSFIQIQDQWRTVPVPPQRLLPGLPAGLGELVMELLRIDAGSRPRSAAEVMERLLSFLPSPPAVELEAAQAYLVNPQLVGRDQVLMCFRRRLLACQRTGGGGFLLTGQRGVGRSRMLDAFVMEAKLSGAVALRAGYSDAAAGPLGLGYSLARQLHVALPHLIDELSDSDPEIFGALRASEWFAVEGGEAPAPGSMSAPIPLQVKPEGELGPWQRALQAYLLAATRERVLAIAIDDLEAIHGAPSAFLAALTFEASRCRMLFAFALADDGPVAVPAAVDLIREHAETLPLSTLNSEHIASLLRSVFGEVPHLQRVCQTLYPLSAGLPRECMALAQSLVERGLARYADGTWSLPSTLSPTELVSTLDQGFSQRMGGLSPLGRAVVLMLALDVAGHLDREGLASLFPDSAPFEMEAALYELVAGGLLARGDLGYALSHRAFVASTLSAVDDEEIQRCHCALARLHKSRNSPAVVVAHHQLSAGALAEGVASLVNTTADVVQRLRLVDDSIVTVGSQLTASTLRWAVQVADQQQRPVAEKLRLWVAVATMAAYGEDAEHFHEVAPRWLARLRRDSGLLDLEQLPAEMESHARAVQAVSAAQARFESTPQHERCLTPLEAIRQMGTFVALGMAVGGRTLDLSLPGSFVELLAPFRTLHPALALMFDHARAGHLLALGQRWTARTLFVDVLARIEQIHDPERNVQAFLEALRSSVRWVVAVVDASLGLYSNYVQTQERSRPQPAHVAISYYTMKISALHHGDWGAAERCRQQAELWTLQSGVKSMFSTLEPELEAHGLARDLTGVRQVRARVAELAAIYPGWRVVLGVADAWYLRLREQPKDALLVLDRVEAEHGAGDEASPWLIQACTLRVSVLTDLQEAAGAVAVGEPMLRRCRENQQFHLGRLLSCELAQAYAALGLWEQAKALMAEVLAEQQALGVHGLLLAYSHEVCARVAIRERDLQAFNQHAAHAATYYNWSARSGLSPLYECLLDDAREAGLLGGDGTAPVAAPSTPVDALAAGRVAAALSPCSDAHERAEQALGLLCEDSPQRTGYLLLTGDDGLFIAACRTPESARAEVLDFARAYIDSLLTEQDLSRTVSVTLDSPEKGFEDPSGRYFEVQALFASAESDRALVGLALLSDLELHERAQVQRLAQAIAVKLHQEGDVTPSAAQGLGPPFA